jgi:hypothetical protein
VGVADGLELGRRRSGRGQDERAARGEARLDVGARRMIDAVDAHEAAPEHADLARGEVGEPEPAEGRVHEAIDSQEPVRRQAREVDQEIEGRVHAGQGQRQGVLALLQVAVRGGHEAARGPPARVAVHAHLDRGTELRLEPARDGGGIVHGAHVDRAPLARGRPGSVAHVLAEDPAPAEVRERAVRIAVLVPVAPGRQAEVQERFRERGRGQHEIRRARLH